MSVSVALLTPTGLRPECLRHCQRYISRFEIPDDVSHVEWILIDDGQRPSHVDFDHEYISLKPIRPVHVWNGTNTLKLNLLSAIPFIRSDFVLFIEDDDWYSPEYLKHQIARLQNFDIVGETPSHYYHVPSMRYRVFENRVHASLCQTGIRSSLLPVLKEVCTVYNDFIDVRLWDKTSHLRQKFEPGLDCIGMKGLQGRPGIGIGHRPDQSWGWKSDNNGSVLNTWVGSDSQLYLQTKSASVGR